MVLQVTRTHIQIKPDPARVFFRPFESSSKERSQRIVARVTAMSRSEAEQEAAREKARQQGAAPPVFDSISLRQRCKPIIDMLTRCHREQQPVLWGV